MHKYLFFFDPIWIIDYYINSMSIENHELIILSILLNGNLMICGKTKMVIVDTGTSPVLKFSVIY